MIAVQGRRSTPTTKVAATTTVAHHLRRLNTTIVSVAPPTMTAVTATGGAIADLRKCTAQKRKGESGDGGARG